MKLFPEFSVDQVRAALLRVADLAEDDSAFLPAEAPVWDLLEAARSRAGLEENEAMALALEATNETRK